MEREGSRPETPPGGQPRERTFAPTRLESARPPVGTWLAVMVVALAIAVVKPWATEPPRSASAGAVGEGRAVTGAAVDAGPSPVPTVRPDSAGPLVAAFCLDPQSWRLATVERWRDQTIRVWRAIEPASAATDPDDPRIPVFPIVSEGVTELGWCAPVVGPDRPDGVAPMHVWRRTAAGPVAIPTRNTRSADVESSFGGLYRPPGPAGTEVWADGTYVFEHRALTGRERWFAVEVELRASTRNLETEGD
jgi:hypothetical protein